MSVWVRPVYSARVEYSNLTSDGAVRHGVFRGLREVGADAAGGAGAQAADLGGGSRDGLGDQPDPAALRAVGAGQARRRGLLCRGRRLHAAASLRAAGEPGALSDRQARGLLLPAAPVPRDAGGARQLRDPDQRRGGPDLPDRRRRRAATSRWRSSGWSSSTPGAAGWRRWSGPTGWSSTSTPAKGSPGARWSRRRCTCGSELAALGLDALRQDHGRQGGPRRGAGDAEARLEGGARGDRRDRRRGSPRAAPETFTTVMGAPNRRAADLHRLPPQRPQRHRGGALFVAGAQQSAGICAA